MVRAQSMKNWKRVCVSVLVNFLPGIRHNLIWHKFELKKVGLKESMNVLD